MKMPVAASVNGIGEAKVSGIARMRIANTTERIAEMTTTQIILEVVIIAIVYWIGVGMGYITGVIKMRNEWITYGVTNYQQIHKGR